MANCNYKVKIKDIQNKYKFKIFSPPRGEQGDLNHNDIIDNLNSTDNTKVLSAKQGKILKDLVDKKPYYFNSVAEMKLYDLQEGDYAITKGYYSDNDGGASSYIIKSSGSNYYETLNNNLVAEIIINNSVTPEQFGAKGDGTTDDTLALQNAFNSGHIVITKNIYKITSRVNIKNSIFMEGNSYIIADTSLTGVAVSIAQGTQQIEKEYHVNVNANGVSSTAIAIGSPRKCNLYLNVINAGETGINTNYYSSTGNNENQFTCNVIGNSVGTTINGIIVNCYDNIFHSIVTQDCQYGVKLDGGELIAESVHSWLSNEVSPILWENSAVINDVSYYHFQINWLYQDSIKYGVYGVGPYGHINHFEYHNTLTNSENYTGMLNVNVTNGAARLTIDTFKNNKNENLLLSFNLPSNSSHEFGVLIKNGVSAIPNVIQNNPTFNDANNCPQWGGYWVLYDVTNLPVGQNGYLKSEVVGSSVIQTFYPSNYSENPRYYIRIRQISTSTWSSWSRFVPATT